MLGLSTLQKKIVDWLTVDRRFFEYPMCDFERIRYELRPCDVILVEGRSRVSDVIRVITQSPWTHSGLYVGRLHDIDDPELRKRISEFYQGPPNEQLIIEGMMGQGTIVTPLSTYKDDHVRICRPSGISRTDAQLAIAHCVERLGSDYDMRQIFDLARFLIPWSFLPRRWRSSIFSQHPGSYTRTVCSTVIAEAFGAVSFPLLPAVVESADGDIELVHRNPRLFTPRDFDYSPFFEIIKFPFLNIVEKGVYRQLPWNERLISNDKHGVIDQTNLPRQRG